MYKQILWLVCCYSLIYPLCNVQFCLPIFILFFQRAIQNKFINRNKMKEQYWYSILKGSTKEIMCQIQNQWHAILVFISMNMIIKAFKPMVQFCIDAHCNFTKIMFISPALASTYFLYCGFGRCFFCLKILSCHFCV